MMESINDRRISGRAAPAEVDKGFTLVELMVTIAIAAILLMVAVPSFDDALLNGKLTSQSNAVLSTLQLARSEAIKRNARVTVCKSAQSTTPPSGTCTSSGGWNQGWIIFHDADGDGVLDAGETIVQRGGALAPGFSLTGDANLSDAISFVSSGGATQSGTLSLCRAQPTVGATGRTISILGTGRPTIAKTTVTSCS